jgi:hypothetical protein
MPDCLSGTPPGFGFGKFQEVVVLNEIQTFYFARIHRFKLVSNGQAARCTLTKRRVDLNAVYLVSSFMNLFPDLKVFSRSIHCQYFFK